MAKKKTTKKKAAAKKVVKKKATTKKPAKKVVKKANKKATKKKATKKKAVAKKATTKKKVTKKKVTKKKVTKKSPAKKLTKKKLTKKKVMKKKAAAKKAGKKKVTKKATKKKVTKKVTKKATKKASAKPAVKPATPKPNGPAPGSLEEAMHKEWTVAQLKRVKTGLKKKDLDVYLKELLERRAEIVGNVKGMEDARNASLGDISHMPLHMADVGSDNFEQEFTLGLMESEREMLREIDEAIMRMREGYYGVCLASGRPIQRMRLEFAPWAKYCIDVARAKEKGGGW